MKTNDVQHPLICVTGTRGIPASWGGVERQCEELYVRLAAMGLDVLVYARKPYVGQAPEVYKGVRIKVLPASRRTYLEAIGHTALSILHMAFRNRPDILHVYSQGPCLALPLARLLLPGAKIVFTCGGLDWQRRKWTGLAAKIIRLGEYFSARLTDRRIMVSQALKDYYRERYGCDCDYLPNGVNIPDGVSPAPLADMGLAPGGYFLFVGRLTPEKRVEDVIRAFKMAPGGLKLAIAGEDASGGDYMDVLRREAEGIPDVVFCGYRYGPELSALYAFARAFVTASELEGMPLVLLEAMGHRAACVASAIAPHVEVLGEDYPWFFQVGDLGALADLLRLAAEEPEKTEAMGLRCVERVAERFNWDAIASRLAAIYRETLPRKESR